MKNKTEILEQQIKQKSEELEQFVYIVSHDVKAPVRAINNLVSWIEEDLGQMTDSVKEYFGLLKGRVGRIEKMMDALTELSRVKRLELEIAETNVSKIINNIIDIIPDKGQITVETGDMPVFRTMYQKLFKVLNILIINAFQFHDKNNGWIKIQCTDNKDHYLFEIKDNGPGIAEEYHQKIFTIFYTLCSKDTHETTGAGLSIAKAIVEFAGGQMNVSSKPGEGSNFYFTWPKAENLTTN